MSTDKKQPVMDQEWVGTEEYDKALAERPQRVLVTPDGQCTPLMPVRSATEAILGGFRHVEERDLDQAASEVLVSGDPMLIADFPERDIMQAVRPEGHDSYSEPYACVVMTPMSTPGFTSPSLTEKQLRGHAMRRLMAKVDELTVSMIRTLAEGAPEGGYPRALITQAPPDMLDEPCDVGMSFLASGEMIGDVVDTTAEYLEYFFGDEVIQLVSCPAVNDNVIYHLAAPPYLGRLVALSPPIVRSARLKGGQLYVWAETNLGAAVAKESVRVKRFKHAVDETEDDDAEADEKCEEGSPPGCKPGVETVPGFLLGPREITPTPRRDKDVKSDVKAPVDECAAFGVINKSATAHCCFSNTVVRNEPDGETTNVCECIDSPMEDESDQWAYRIALALNQAEE